MIIVADKNGQIDSAYHTLVKHIQTDKTIVMVSWADNFVFNDALLSVKDYLLIDFCEEGWDTPIVDTHIFGKNSEKFPRYYNNDWVKFDNWVKENPPKLTFKRELLKKDVSEKVKPIEYPCVAPQFKLDNEELFNNRPISVFQYWGRSSEHRLRIHGEIWLHGYKKGFQVLDNIYFYNDFMHHERGEKWITLWMPHWARMDMKPLMEINGTSKLSLSWPGAGFKCFRTAEAPVNSVMVMWENNYAWSYDWNETNCILVQPGKEIEGIEKALNNPILHEIYLAGVETCNKYRLERYISEYIEPLINNA